MEHLCLVPVEIPTPLRKLRHQSRLLHPVSLPVNQLLFGNTSRIYMLLQFLWKDQEDCSRRDSLGCLLRIMRFHQQMKLNPWGWINDFLSRAPRSSVLHTSEALTPPRLRPPHDLVFTASYILWSHIFSAAASSLGGHSMCIPTHVESRQHRLYMHRL